jgi:hypothetical protein
MADSTTPHLDLGWIEIKSSVYFAEMMDRLKQRRTELGAEGKALDTDGFIRVLQSEVGHPPIPSMQDEDRIGFLIAITGLIQEYLENEQGVSFKLRE